MGMAASQARFLGLTARKSNVEFEGQQVNQQRTTLANQSANYYNQLLGMKVPTPPSTNDFTKTTYTFEDGNLSNSITSLVAKSDGTYLASYVSSWVNDFTPVVSGNAIINRASTGSYNDLIDTHEDITFEQLDPADPDTKYQLKLNATEEIIETNLVKVDTYEYMDNVNNLRYKEVVDPNDSTKNNAEVYALTYNYTIGSNTLRVLGNVPAFGSDAQKADPYLKTLSPDQLNRLATEERNYITMLDKKYGSDGNWLVRYTLNSTDGTYSPTFYRENVVKKAIYNDETGISQSNIQSYKMGSATETEEIKGKMARLEKDSTGRYINITLYDDLGKNPVTYALTTNTVTDQNAYNDAMNQYEYNKHQYEQSLQEINSKIEIIQTEDKNLELRLKQLDTEQEAIMTEIDSITKVVDKNIEKSFNSFA